MEKGSEKERVYREKADAEDDSQVDEDIRPGAYYTVRWVH